MFIDNDPVMSFPPESTEICVRLTEGSERKTLRGLKRLKTLGEIVKLHPGDEDPQTRSLYLIRDVKNLERMVDRLAKRKGVDSAHIVGARTVQMHSPQTTS